MRQIICFIVLLGIAFVLGCASIHAKNAADRMSAVAKMETQSELRAAVYDTEYEDVRIAAVKRIIEQETLVGIVQEARFSDEVRLIAIAAITNQPFLAEFAICKTSPVSLAMIAVHGIEREELLLACACNAYHERVAVLSADKLKKEESLVSVVLCKTANRLVRENCLLKISSEDRLGDIGGRCKDRWIRQIVVSKIRGSLMASRLLLISDFPSDLKLLLIDRISDESFLCEYVKNRANEQSVRRKCLSKVQSEDLYRSLLRYTPPFEDWVVSQSIKVITSGADLVYAVVNTDFSVDNRKLAFSKLKTQNEFQQVFEHSTDDLSIRSSLEKLDVKWLNATNGQAFVVRNFRLAIDNVLKNWLLTKMTSSSLVELFRKSDQERIAQAVAADPSDRVLDIARESLFNSEVICDLAMGKYASTDKITYWALELNPSESVLVDIALKSPNLPMQSRALARISDEDMIAKVALCADKSALRIAAIARLTMKSEVTLNELAQVADVAVKNAAIERLRVIGGKKVVEFERKAELERLRRLEQQKKLAEEQKAREEYERKTFEQKYLTALGSSQISIIKKYIEINGRAHIDSPKFEIVGRVKKFEGRQLCLIVSTIEGEVSVQIEMSRKSKESFAEQEIVRVSGFDDESTPDKLCLRCGDLVERGIELK